MPVALEHASWRVFLGRIDHLVCLFHGFFISLHIRRGPPIGLGNTRQDENQLDLRIASPRLLAIIRTVLKGFWNMKLNSIKLDGVVNK